VIEKHTVNIQKRRKTLELRLKELNTKAHTQHNRTDLRRYLHGLTELIDRPRRLCLIVPDDGGVDRGDVVRQNLVFYLNLDVHQTEVRLPN